MALSKTWIIVIVVSVVLVVAVALTLGLVFGLQSNSSSNTSEKLKNALFPPSLIQDLKLARELFAHLPYSDEVPERLSAFYFVEPTDYVLEIGGNVGGVSLVIAEKLNDSSKQLVVLEPGYEDFAKLNENMKQYKKQFQVFHGPIVAEGQHIKCERKNRNEYVVCTEVSYPMDNNITFTQLEQKFQIQFDTLVIDCEGCYTKLLRQGLESGTMKNIRKIIIEWDGDFLEQEFFQHGFKLVSERRHANLKYGVRVYIR